MDGVHRGMNFGWMAEDLHDGVLRMFISWMNIGCTNTSSFHKYGVWWHDMRGDAFQKLGGIEEA
jgi:hypothetical protein